MNDQPSGSRIGQQPASLEHSGGHRRPGFVSEFIQFFLHNKKWWLTPIIVVLLLLGLLVALAGSVAPFIYPLF